MSRLGNMALPLVLAGPILRRAEPARVCIWLATSDPVEIGGEVFHFEADGSLSREPIAAGASETIALGQHLFVHLVCVVPQGGDLPTDELLAYDLHVEQGGSRKGLRDLGLLHGPGSIAYGDLPLPTFWLRRDVPELTLMHGSCRGFRGDGEDALAAGDEIVARHVRDLPRRPSALFLTGDQIYGDDVAGPMIRHLTNLGTELVGWNEEASIPGLQPVSSIPVFGRKEIARDRLRFTSDRQRNHLITFGEYAAMYLCAWSDTGWPRRLPSVDECVPWERWGRAKGAWFRHKYKDDLRSIEPVRRSLPAVRRLLANVPTYMTFDDHDVTDDWNLTERWRHDASHSPGGRRVVANALAAFWAFQGWGNQPDHFDASFKSAVGGYLTQDGNVGPDRFEDTLWSFDNWWFHAPTRPPAICLDTRTQRGYDSRDGAPMLLNDHGLKKAKETIDGSGYRGGERIILVSPVPVFGIELQERRQKFLAQRIRATKIDLEAWHSNLRGFVAFLALLVEEIGLTECLFLSGDVHYGFNAKATFATRKGELTATQLVSSALRHGEVSSALIMDALGRLVGHVQVRLGWERPPDLGRLPWLKRRLVRRAPNVDEWNGDELSFLAAHRARRLGIEGRPDYRERKEYAGLSGTSSTLVGENNLGLVRVRGDEVTHELLTRDSKRKRPSTAVLSLTAAGGPQHPERE